MLSHINFRSSSRMAPVVNVGEVNKEQRCVQMDNAINEIASDASRFVHRLAPNSPTAAVELKSEYRGDGIVSGQCLVKWSSIINRTRANMVTVFKQDIAEWGWENRHFAVVNSHSAYAIRIIETRAGDCSEQAFLAGILVKATLHTGLKRRGFSEEEIAKADIRLTIAELREQDNLVNSHVICLLSYDTNDEDLIFIDPWINGAVFNHKNADDFFAAHIDNLQKPYIAAKVHADKTMAANDDRCVSRVIESVSEHYEIDWNSLRPFAEYV